MNRGTLFVLIGGSCWGLSGVCGEYLFKNTSFSPTTLCMIRLTVSGLLILVLSFFLAKKDLMQLIKTPRDMIQAILFGTLGLAFCQSTYLLTIEHSNASTATVLQYISPIWFILITSLYYKKRPQQIELICVCLALIGTYFIATKGSFTSIKLTHEGLFWGIISSLSVVTYSILPKPLLKKYSSLPVMGIGMFMGGLFMLPFSEKIHVVLTGMDLLALFGIVVVGTAIAFSFYLIGISEIGLVKGSVLASVEPIIATILGFLWLHTKFTIWDLIGFSLIISIVFLLALKPATSDTL